MLETRFTKLVGCSVPIQQAGRAVLANPELAERCQERGDWELSRFEGILRAKITEELMKARKRTSHPLALSFAGRYVIVREPPTTAYFQSDYQR